MVKHNIFFLIIVSLSLLSMYQNELFLPYIIFFISILFIILVLKKDYLEPFEILREYFNNFDVNDIEYLEYSGNNKEFIKIKDVINGVIERLKIYSHIRDKLAYYDNLTGLYNRNSFYKILQLKLFNRERFSLVFIDIENFKFINDIAGHYTGDKVLQIISKKLDKFFSNSFVFRIDGDEFAIIVNETDKTTVKDTLNRLKTYIQEDIVTDGYKFNIDINIGIVINYGNIIDKNSITRYGNISLQKSKKIKDIVIFNKELLRETKRELQLEMDIKKAIENSDFFIVVQPKFYCKCDKEIYGFESLLRWDRDGELIPPDKFIRFLENSIYIKKVSLMVLRESMKFIKEVKKYSDNIKRISVNMSIKMLKDSSFIDDIKKIIKEEDIDPSFLEFEITERAITTDDNIIRNINILKKIGIYISIDDFGTEYSSIAKLNEIPVDIIKIDRCFVTDIENKSKLKILKFIHNLADELGCGVVVEGVENRKQFEILRQHGFYYMQGYYLSKPLKLDDAIKMIKGIK